MKYLTSWLIFTAFFLVPTVQAQTATAKISGPDITGTALLVQQTDGTVRVTVIVKGDPKTLTPGLHGIHFHEAGLCEMALTPAFSSAKGHFDPGPSGSSTPVEANHPYHLGDLPNLLVNENGEGKLQTITSRITLSEGPLSIFDSNGTALIIHKNPDLMKAMGTAPEAGGGRLACGVLENKIEK